MFKQALLGAILVSSASLTSGQTVSGKCAGNSASATDLSYEIKYDMSGFQGPIISFTKYQFDCTGGYILKDGASGITFAGNDAAAKTATCCDVNVGKCGGNKDTATDLAEQSSSGTFQFACGAGYTLIESYERRVGFTKFYKARSDTRILPSGDAAAKKAGCCEAVSGQCSNNAVTATGLAEASTPAGTFQFACGDEFLKPNYAVPGSGDAAAQKAACCEIPKCSSQSTNHNFCGTGKELDGTKSDTNCDAAACNSDASRTACCKTSGATGAACSTIATSPGWCGGQIYDSSKATSKCAGTPCSSLAGSDTTACCKDGPNGAECSTIASTEGFCGPQKVYNPGKATSKCADTPCNALTASDTAACCKDGVFGKCGGNTATATNLAEKKDEFYQFACGTGFAVGFISHIFFFFSIFLFFLTYPSFASFLPSLLFSSILFPFFLTLLLSLA